MRIFEKGVMPELTGLEFKWFRKRPLTRAAFVAGEFQCETPHGIVVGKDCWVAIDAHGYPYPITADEFSAIYMEVGE